MPSRHLDSAAATTYMAPWQIAITPVKIRRGHNNPTPSSRSESQGYRRPMYCATAKCGAYMPEGDVGLTCPDCRAAVVLRP